MKHANWLGRPVRAEGKGSFAPPGPGGGTEPDARWPRSGAADLALALDTLFEAGEDWCALEGEERARALRAFLREVEAGLVRGGELAHFLGLEADEWERFSGFGRPRLEELTRGGVPRPRPGITVLSNHWSELAVGPLGDLVPALLAGRGVLLLVDERFPHLGDVLGAAWARRSPVPAALAVLQGPERALVVETSEDPDVDDVLVVATERRIAEFAADAAIRTREVASAEAEVSATADLPALARRLARAAFGREMLSGQRAGQVARILVDERVFSRFTALFLAETERMTAAHPPLPLIDRASARDVRELAQLGLDEGATLIHGGETTRLVERDRVSVPPLIFTNVETEMRLFARRAPAPLALLVRAPQA